MNIEIVYQDDSMFVIDKLGGVPSVPGRNPAFTKNLYHSLLDEIPPVYVVHRLDINTSGLIVFARTRQAQVELQKQFAQRKVKKTYHAVVNGEVSSVQGEINLPLTTDWPKRPLQKLCMITGKASRTAFRVISQNTSYSLLELFPLTGRSHQLRIHTALIGHPIVGCNLYANSDVHYGRFIKPATMSNDTLFLHASRIQFHHPTKYHMVDIKSRRNFFKTAETRFQLNLPVAGDLL